MSANSTPVSSAGSLRVLAALLDYPTPALRAQAAEMRTILRREAAFSDARRGQIEGLLDDLESRDLLDAEADYVQLFDRGRDTSLHLFEHVHGDSRARGPAMIDLTQTYEQAGLYLAPGELPDYLPVVLEFISTRSAEEARAFLGELAPLLNILHTALRRRESGYAAILAATLELAGETPKALHQAADEPSLDQIWDEPPAFGACPSSGPAWPGQPQTIQFVRQSTLPGVAV